MLSIDNAKAARPLIADLEVVRAARNQMNRAPALLRIFLVQGFGTCGSSDMHLPNDVARKVLDDEEKRLVQALADLGVQA